MAVRAQARRRWLAGAAGLLAAPSMLPPPSIAAKARARTRRGQPARDLR